MDTYTEANNKTQAKSRQYIKFETGNQAFGINVLNSREIVMESEITSIPESPDFVKGVINLREEIVPIVNLDKLFNIKLSDENIEEKKIIIIKVEETLIGLEVDGVDEIIEIENNRIKSAPSITKKYNKDYIRGVANHNDKLFIILDVNNIFSSDEIEEIKEINS
ncbi:MAG: chemotaxis protein CheW [Halanaerobiales bacterium]|nr:chemotaxis protein CheW [Halanaerobiales bacterium]